MRRGGGRGRGGVEVVLVAQSRGGGWAEILPACEGEGGGRRGVVWEEEFVL